MFGTVKRIIDWCGSFKKNLYIGFVFSFFSGWFAAMPVIWAAYIIGKLVECEGQGNAVSTVWIGKSIVILLFFVFLRFLFDYLRARFQESISYELIARDRLAVGDALKRVSLGYFQNMNTGTILNSITTHDAECALACCERAIRLENGCITDDFQIRGSELLLEKIGYNQSSISGL